MINIFAGRNIEELILEEQVFVADATRALSKALETYALGFCRYIGSEKETKDMGAKAFVRFAIRQTTSFRYGLALLEQTDKNAFIQFRLLDNHETELSVGSSVPETVLKIFQSEFCRKKENIFTPWEPASVEMSV